MIGWMDGRGDDRQRIYRTRLKVHLWSVSGGAQTDGCFNCQKKKSLDIFCQRQKAGEVARSVTQSLICAQWEVLISSSG